MHIYTFELIVEAKQRQTMWKDIEILTKHKHVVS